MRFTSECKTLVITDFGTIIIATDGYTLHQFEHKVPYMPTSHRKVTKQNRKPAIVLSLGSEKSNRRLSLQRVQIVQEKFVLTLKLLH